MDARDTAAYHFYQVVDLDKAIKQSPSDSEKYKNYNRVNCKINIQVHIST